MITLGELKIDIQRHFNAEQEHVTVAQIFDRENKLLTRGRSVCSNKDCNNKGKGRKIALSKAITGSNIPKDVRRDFWEQYRTNMTKSPRW